MKSRESGDEKSAKLGQPVTQSLILLPRQPPQGDSSVEGAADQPKDDPLIYLL